MSKSGQSARTFRKQAERAARQERSIQRKIDRKTKSKGRPSRQSHAMQAGARNYPAPELPGQHLRKPGREADLKLAPMYEAPGYRGSEKLRDMVALITGGDSGIGRAVAVLFAREGADVELSAIHNDVQAASQAVPQVIAVLTAAGYSNIKFDIDTGAKAALRPAFRDDNDKFDAIVCPGGKQGVDEVFFGENQWRWVRVDPRKVDGVKYLAIYETLFDAENNNAPGGRGEVIAYAPVLGYEIATNGPELDKYCFNLGKIERLAIPAGNLLLRNLRYTKLEDLLKAETLADLFQAPLITRSVANHPGG